MISKDVLYVGLGRVASALIALVLIRVVTTVLTPEQYGQLVLLTTVQMFCGLFLINPVAQYVSVNTHEWWGAGKICDKLNSYYKYVFIVSLVGGLCMLLLANFGFKTDVADAGIMMFMVFFATVNATLIPLMNMVGFRGHSVLFAVLTSVVGLVFSIALSYYQPSATTWFFGQSIGLAMGALIAYAFLRKKYANRIVQTENTFFLKKDAILNYCLPLAFATGFMWILLGGYRFVIENYWGLERLGFFALGMQLAAQIWWLVESLVMQFFYPYFFKGASEIGDQKSYSELYSNLLNSLLPAYFLIAGLMFISAPFLIKILVSDAFGNSISFFFLGVIVEICRVIGNVFSNIAHVKRMTMKLIPPYAIGAFVCILAIGISGTFDMDIFWAAIGLMLGGLFMMVSMVFLMYRLTPFSIDRARIFSSLLLMVTMLIFSLSVQLRFEKMGSLFALGVVAILGLPLLYYFISMNPAVKRLTSIELK